LFVSFQHFVLKGNAFRVVHRKPAFRGVGIRKHLEVIAVANLLARINALAELRQRATREGHCYQHVQAITVAIDQYAEKALGNRDYFLNKPYGVG
jgi:hypothetical protein